MRAHMMESGVAGAKGMASIDKLGDAIRGEDAERYRRRAVLVGLLDVIETFGLDR